MYSEIYEFTGNRFQVSCVHISFTFMVKVRSALGWFISLRIILLAYILRHLRWNCLTLSVELCIDSIYAIWSRNYFRLWFTLINRHTPRTENPSSNKNKLLHIYTNLVMTNRKLIFTDIILDIKATKSCLFPDRRK